MLNAPQLTQIKLGICIRTKISHLFPLPVSTMKSYTWVLAYDLSPPAPGIRKLEVQVSEAVLGLLLPS